MYAAMVLLIGLGFGFPVHADVTTVKPVDQVLADYGVRFRGGQDFKVLKDSRQRGASKHQHFVELKSERGERIEIKIVGPIEPGAAESLLQTERLAISKVYAAPQTPYMGDIAQAIGGCPAALGPLRQSVRVAGVQAEAVVGAAKDQFAFGACSNSEAKFKGALIAYYNPETKSLWTWRVFAPWDAKGLNSEWLNTYVSRFER